VQAWADEKGATVDQSAARHQAPAARSSARRAGALEALCCFEALELFSRAGARGTSARLIAAVAALHQETIEDRRRRRARRPLRAVPGAGTRPTADRVRQSLSTRSGRGWTASPVLDLYAGTGALALEALSRGAARAVLVENDARACGVIFHNLSALKYGDRSRGYGPKCRKRSGSFAASGFDLVFSDPPYALRAAQPTLEALASNDLLAPGARVVLETDRREPAPTPPLA